jgi:hypothetical protein
LIPFVPKFYGVIEVVEREHVAEECIDNDDGSSSTSSSIPTRAASSSNSSTNETSENSPMNQWGVQVHDKMRLVLNQKIQSKKMKFKKQNFVCLFV